MPFTCVADVTPYMFYTTVIIYILKNPCYQPSALVNGIIFIVSNSDNTEDKEKSRKHKFSGFCNFCLRNLLIISWRTAEHDVQPLSRTNESTVLKNR